MDIELFLQMLDIDSTSGKEAEFADFLAGHLTSPRVRVERFDVGEGTYDLLFSWGRPKVVFCSHLDTVPSYIAPAADGNIVRGRGACDAKGQIFSMWEACRRLEAAGRDGFGLLLLAGEETGSWGAKAFDALMGSGAIDTLAEDPWVIVGEPTGNVMTSASKGTKAFEVSFAGKAFHSGYPQYGISAVDMFMDFMNALRSIGFPHDELLGDTTWNVGQLRSDNPQNILSDSLSCRVYFRTTSASDEMVCNLMKNIAGEDARLRFGKARAQDGSDLVGREPALWQKCMSVKALGGDSPTVYDVLEGFPVGPVSFGSDAPQLKSFRHRILYGPGSILVAHRPDEHISLAEIEAAASAYVRMYEMIQDI